MITFHWIESLYDPFLSSRPGCVKRVRGDRYQTVTTRLSEALYGLMILVHTLHTDHALFGRQRCPGDRTEALQREACPRPVVHRRHARYVLLPAAIGGYPLLIDVVGLVSHEVIDPVQAAP